MKHVWLSDLLLIVGLSGLAIDNFWLRRRLRVDRLAREAEDALGPPHIGDIVMPDPSDARWKEEEHAFASGGGKSTKKHVLALGPISVTDEGHVFIGTGAPVEGGQHYGKRVLRAYRQQLVDQVRGAK